MTLSLYLERLTKNLFSHPYASQGKDSRGIFAPARKVTKKYALGMRVIQLNGPRQKRFLAFDIDRPYAGLAWEEANLPIPNLVITNPRNGHAHLVWELSEPVWERRRDDERLGEALPVRYLKAVYRAMREALNADPGYNGLLVKNPLHRDWDVVCGRLQPYSLSELAEHLDLSQAYKPQLRNNSDGRNCTLFDSIRIWAYRSKSYHDNLSSFRSALDEELDYLNSQLDSPLSDRELAGIAKSVSRWVWNKYTGSGKTRRRGICKIDYHLPLIEKQQLGQSESSRIRINNSRNRIRQAIISINNQGIPLTKAEVSRRSGLDRKTVYRHWEHVTNLVTSTDTLSVTEETVSLRDEASNASPTGMAALSGRERYPEAYSKVHPRIREVLMRAWDAAREARPPPTAVSSERRTSILELRAVIDRYYEQRIT